ncbi:kinase family protein [Arabidopsis lyrata subsp. lyrata]|uniref:non-specific serine/threonine protein kinase n=1 Tax=Arabidopsis lyrata subsp. lyrata TaxID=81972 RepID=D7KNL0_ARALL|nr:kinase family protein [Arabidopsis lyrata subsp. lyrata]
MHFPLVSAWNKRRRSKSYDTDPYGIKGSTEQQSAGKSKIKRLSQGSEDSGHQFIPSRRWRRPQVLSAMRSPRQRRLWSSIQRHSKNRRGFVMLQTLFYGRGAIRVVAIKKMDLPTFKKADGEREFRVEVDILSRLDHPNLVSLIGYCADGKHRFLVYEYMQNGNLQDHLNGIKEAKISWSIRLRIALGAAKGLAYLHSSSSVGIPIVHRDFKSTNVLLDSNYDAKISDFGLAKLMPEGKDTCVTARVLGTFGYFDPEYTSTGKLTLQSDIYAFGVVLLELLTGRRAVDLTQGPNEQNLVLQVRNILNDRKKLRKVIDAELPRNSYSMEAIAMFADLASRCIRIESKERPSVMDCVKELQLIIYTNSKGGLGGTIPTFRRL